MVLAPTVILLSALLASGWNLQDPPAQVGIASEPSVPNTWNLQNPPNETTDPVDPPGLSLSDHRDYLDLIVDRNSSPEERGDAYQRLTEINFPLIASKLAYLMSINGFFSSIGSRTNHPWTESQLSLGDQIGCTLDQLWSYHLAAAKPGADYIGLLLSILEKPYSPDFKVSPPPAPLPVSYDGGRGIVARDLGLYLNQTDSRIAPLDRLARDPEQSRDLRLQLLEILIEHGNPNPYLDLAIEVSSEKSSSSEASEAFRFCIPPDCAAKFTPENRKKYLRYAATLLEEIDDGHGGGYFLAAQIGLFAGVPSPRPGDDPFIPDRNLPRYRGARFEKYFFQDTVDNARKWWKKNKANY